MPGDVRVRVVFDRFPQITQAMAAKADAIVMKATMDLEAQMKVRAAVRTGFLRASIQGARVGPAHGRVVVGAEYGAYVEYGTRSTAPHPFRQPAVDVIRPVFLAAMRKVVS